MTLKTKFTTFGRSSKKELTPFERARICDPTCRLIDGYIAHEHKGEWILAHRLGWALYYGKWPTGEIEHINGIKTDNRIVNLREVPK